MSMSELIETNAERTRVDEPLSIRRDIRFLGDRLLEIQDGFVWSDRDLKLKLTGACMYAMSSNYPYHA